MTNDNMLREILEDNELKQFWPEINVDAINPQTVGTTSKNPFLQLVQLHMIKKGEVMTKKKLENLIHSIFDV